MHSNSPKCTAEANYAGIRFSETDIEQSPDIKEMKLLGSRPIDSAP